MTSGYRLTDLTPSDLTSLMEEAVRRVLGASLHGVVREAVRAELSETPRTALATVAEIAAELGVHADTVQKKVRAARLPRFDSLGAPDAGGRYIRRADLAALHYAPTPRTRRSGASTAKTSAPSRASNRPVRPRA